MKQTKESHAVLEGVASGQTQLVKQLESGHEVNRRRLVEMETTLEKRVTETSEKLLQEQGEKSGKLMSTIQGEPLGAFGRKGHVGRAFEAKII